MKRAIAWILTLVMLLALIPVNATVNAEASDEKPFVFTGYIDPGSAKYPNVYWTTKLWVADMSPERPDPITVCYGIASDAESIIEIAKPMKADFDQRPDGARFFDLCLVQTAFHGLVENHIYFTDAINVTKNWLNKFLGDYKSIGGKLDGIIVDLEYIQALSWMLDSSSYEEIVDDPRFDTEIRPELEKYAFVFSNGETEISCISSATGEHHRCADIWDQVMGEYAAASINKAVLETLHNYYPEASLCDYQSAKTVVWEKFMETHGMELEYNTVNAGTNSNISSYVGGPEIAFFVFNTPTYNKFSNYNEAVFEKKPFNAALFDTNKFKSMYLSSSNEIDVWVAPYRHGEQEDLQKAYGTTYCGTPYYTETMLHFGLMNPEKFLGYYNPPEITASGSTINEALTIISDIMVELTRVAGTADRKPINVSVDWNSGYILSGMYAGGRNIWRITPDTSRISVEDFKVADKDPTFSFEGLTITFPGGKIVEDGNISVAGTCGYWVETDKDVYPVVTSSADRYSKYDPSYVENFEKYPVGSSFTSDTAQPEACWKVDGQAEIAENGTGKSLALLGTTNLENTKIVSNITAGDLYALQQAWEVTVTLPSDLNNSAELILLRCSEDDLGIKLSGGNVYINNSGNYQLLDGINLRGSTFTIKREFDFRADDVYTCSYFIYDANGELLTQVMDVKIDSFSLPVSSIGISSVDANSAILIDDYKLYPTGTTVLLQMYDAELGISLSDSISPRPKDTAYRVTWLNATDKTLTAQVYNVVDDKVVDTFDILPGMDGYATGVVKPGTGELVKLAVKVEEKIITPPEGETPSVTCPHVIAANLVSDNGDGQLTLDRRCTICKEKVESIIMPKEKVTSYEIEGTGEAYTTGENGLQDYPALNYYMWMYEGADDRYFVLYDNENWTADDYLHLKEVAPTDDYNVKLSWPVGGNPTTYLKDCDLYDEDGLQIGTAALLNTFPVHAGNWYQSYDIVVESDSSITIVNGAEMPAINAMTEDGTVTITCVDDAVLTLNAPYVPDELNRGMLQSCGDLILKDANIVMEDNAAKNAPFMNIQGTVTVDGGSITMIGCSDAAANLGGICTDFYGGGIVIKNGANVSIKAANDMSYDYYNAILATFTDITISESTAELQVIGGSGYVMNKAPTFEYAEGYVITDENGNTVENADPTGMRYFKIAPCTHESAIYTDNGDGTHTAICNICTNEIVSQHVVHTYVDNGDGTHNGICDVCANVTMKDHTFEEGTCACGAAEVTGPQYDENMVSQQTSLSFQEYIGLQFIVAESVFADYDSFYAEVVQATPDGDVLTTVNGTYFADRGVYMFNQNIQAWSMTENVTITLFGVKDGVVYQGESKTTNVATKAYEMLDSYAQYGAALATYMKILANMLNYGSVVQTVTNHGDLNNLPNALLAEKGYDVYVTATAPELSAESSVSGTGAITVANTSLSLQDKVELGLIFGQSMEGYKVVVSNNGEEVATLEPVAAAGNRFFSIAMKTFQLRDDFQFTVYDAETNEAVSPVYTYSVESVAKSKLKTQPALEPIVNAMLNYCDAFAAIM